MKTIWKAGLSVEQKKAIELEFNSSSVLRERLTHLLNKKIEEARVSSRSSSSYEAANWAFMQADHIGYERALAEVLSLLK